MADDKPNKINANRAAAEARDKLVFDERKARDAANAAKTARLRALRLLHAAAQKG